MIKKIIYKYRESVESLYGHLTLKIDDCKARYVCGIKVHGVERFDNEIKKILISNELKYIHIRYIKEYKVQLIVHSGKGNPGLNPMTNYLVVYESDVDKFGVLELMHSLVYRSYLARLRKFDIFVTRNNRSRVRSIYSKFLT